MAKTTLLLLAIGLLLTWVQGQGGAGTPTPTSVAPLQLTGWTPTCSGSTITIPMDSRFAGYDARLVTYPTSCSKKDSIDLTRNATIPQDCIDQATMSVVLSFQPKKFNGQYIGGKDHAEVKITCSSLGNDGIPVRASVSFNVMTATPQSFTVAPRTPTVTMELVAGFDINTATTVSVVTLGQNNVYLRIKGQDAQQLLLPTKCRGDSQSKTATYDFFSAETGSSTCAYDDEVLGTFRFTTPQVSYAPFYPFMFVSGESVTLTCEVLVCPTSPTGGKCKTTDTSVKSCTAGPVTQTTTPAPAPAPAPGGRRRRSARESEPDTHVVEVTYTVVGHDPALHGQTAAGAGMAVSIPLLAVVASLWIL